MMIDAINCMFLGAENRTAAPAREIIRRGTGKEERKKWVSKFMRESELTGIKAGDFEKKHGLKKGILYQWKYNMYGRKK